jgi:Fur family transcriptional regulator, ferric uptake regulator
MSSADEIIESLRRSGERMTVARREIIRAFTQGASPLSAVGVLSVLRRKEIAANKTTVYRELKFLESKKILRVIQFDEPNRRYQLSPDEHRHHLICTNCKRIDDIVLKDDLNAVEKRLTEQKRFKVQRHALEFYGVCEMCQG